MIKNNFNIMHFLGMLLLTVMLCDAVTAYKWIDMPWGYTSACAFVAPFWFIISDIVTEVYGKKISQQFLLAAIVCEITFCFSCYALIQLPSPTFWNHQQDFNMVLGHLPRIFISSYLAILISGYLNIYFLSKWKVLLKGRYFWLRSIGASCIGECIYTIIAIFCMFYGKMNFSGLLETIFWSYVIKIACTVLLATPANLVCLILKKPEATYHFANPFAGACE